MITLELPWMPSVNHYKKVGAIITTKTGKLYQKRVNTNETKLYYWQVWSKIMGLNPAERVIFHRSATISLELCVDLHPPDKRRRDIDNGLKVLCDSLVRGGLILDDSQIHRLVVEKKSIIAQGKVVIRIQELLPCT
jgi:crossover junction endodeoxyribonuclease RusA